MAIDWNTAWKKSPLELNAMNSIYSRNLDSDRAYEKAAAKGHTVLLPRSNELFIDLDSHEAFTNFRRLYSALYDTVGSGRWEWAYTISANGNVHIYVVMPGEDVTDERRIMLQLLLGSDPMREALSYRRILLRDPRPTLFIEPPPQEYPTQSWNHNRLFLNEDENGCREKDSFEHIRIAIVEGTTAARLALVDNTDEK